MGKFKKLLSKVGSFIINKKKVILIIITMFVAIPIGLSYYRNSHEAQSSEPLTTPYIRTTTLTKGSLENTVSTTGTISSANESTLMSGVTSPIKEILVSVGDEVVEGQTLIVMDTEALYEKITDVNETISETKETLQENYTNAYDDALESKNTAWNNCYGEGGAYGTYESAKNAYESAVSSISYVQSIYDDAYTKNHNAALTMNSLYVDWQTALINVPSDIEDESYASLNQIAIDTESAYNVSKVEYDTTLVALNTAESDLMNSKTQVDFINLESKYNSSKNAYDSLNAIYLAAEEKLALALENLNNQDSSTIDNLEEQLEDYYDTIDDYTLKAETNGTITAINATIGTIVNSNTQLVTISDFEHLIIDVNVEESDIQSISLGLKCNIYTDSTDDVIVGTVSNVSPVATSSGGGSVASQFLVEVSVNDAHSSMLIGMNASVEIVLSSIDNVFIVPLDAVDKVNGQDVIYVQSNQNKEEYTAVSVTVGESNNYYVEVTSSELIEGSTIKATTLNEVITEEEENSGMMMPGMTNGMSSGRVNWMSGEMPDRSQMEGQMQGGRQ